MPHPIIRPATIEDAGDIADLITGLADAFILHEFVPEARARFLSDHTPPSIVRRMQSGFRYHVAESDGAIVGVVGVRDNSHLYHLFVAEAFQGRKLGRELWEHVKAECLAAGNPGAFTVNSSKNAVPVYERFGFTVAAPVQDAGGVLFVPMKLTLAEGGEVAAG